MASNGNYKIDFGLWITKYNYNNIGNKYTSQRTNLSVTFFFQKLHIRPNLVKSKDRIIQLETTDSIIEHGRAGK